MIKGYLDRQIKEIANDTALRFYGACIAFCHFLTFLFWKTGEHAYFLSKSSEPICWGFFENCFAYRVFSLSQVNGMLWCFGFLSGVGVLLFLPKRWVKVAYLYQIALLILKLLFFVWDYRMRMNQHYMLHWVILTYLFIPHKRNNLRYLLVFFYVGASFLKLNMEWMTGSVFHQDFQPMFIPQNLLPAACMYVIILELIIIWGLLSKNKWIYWGVLFQLILFHLTSWTVVGFFYPFLIGSLLMIFPLTYFFPQGNEERSLLKSLFQLRQTSSTYLLAGLFFALQCIPFIYPGDSRITTEGRIFALHMYDARIECEGAITLKYKDGHKQEIKIPQLSKPRIKCDPQVYFSRAKWQCWKNKDDPRFDELDLAYDARLTTQSQMRPLVDVKDFCRKDLRYQFIRPNDWILK